jgi:UDP-2,3-diacylglucosamine pyrophosphatase LpxH
MFMNMAYLLRNTNDNRGETMHRLRYRAIFLSDIHLGTKDAQTEYLLDFLRHTEAGHIYLVGDILDLWKLRSGWHWTRLNNDIVRLLIEKAEAGSIVNYIPGNHDELLRDYTGSVFRGIHLVNEAVHTTADGRRFLLLHGDEFDSVVINSPWLAHAGSWAYDGLLILNRHFNRLRRHLGFPYWSLSAYLKHKVKNAVNHISSFEQALAREAAGRGIDGIICGHIHRATIADVDGVTYANCGDWVESCTALVEDFSGKLSVLHWVEQSGALLAQNAVAAPVLTKSTHSV